MAFFWNFILNIFFINTLCYNPVDKTLFISPVKIPLALSANFGELRIDHFHSGLDIKTQGVTGKEVVASADGYVYRISISPGGFGKALYLRHPSGYSTVYGHLDRFVPDIDEYVKSQQYQRKSYTVTIFPDKDKFRFSQGELIAYSGNTGASGGPHLHYEVRKSDSEAPVNPLLFEFGTEDNIKPVMERIVVYPLSRNTLINNQNGSRKVNLWGGNGIYYIPSENKITISGPAGFGIKSYDQLDNSYNKCSVYSLELIIDSITRYKYTMDEFSFTESRYINSHIDYEAYLRENTYYERTFILPNDNLSVYSNAPERGIFNFGDGKSHHVKIILADAHNNKSSLDFNVEGARSFSSIPIAPEPVGPVIMPFKRANRFRASNISVLIPTGALYDTLRFLYRKNNGTPLMLSDVHYIHNKYTPVHKAYTISIKPSSIPSGKESKLLIIQMSDDFRKSAIASSFSEGYVTGEALSFGMFYVGIDTIAPVISPNGLANGSDLTGRSELRIKITDDVSGIKDYLPLIDGNWALFEYDQKNDVLIYKFDPARITNGSNHDLSLTVTDNKDNMSTYKCSFVW
jgi:hypothetical protein